MDKQKLKCSKASACPFFIQQDQNIKKPAENTVMCLYPFCQSFARVVPFQITDKTNGITRLARLMVTKNDFDQVDSVHDPTVVKKEGLPFFSKFEQE